MTNDTSELAAALRRAREVATCWSEDDLGIVALKGPDAGSFRNNLTTPDLSKVAVGGGAYGFQCTPRGMPETELAIYRVEDETWWCVNRREDKDRLLEHLDKMHFSESFEIEDLRERYALLRVVGAQSADLVAAQVEGVKSLRESSPHSIQQSSDNGTYVAAEPYGPLSGYRMMVNAEDAGSFTDAIAKAIGDAGGESSLADESREALRVESGVLQFGSDIASAMIAQQVGIDHEPFNYNQGCYVGQEIIARIHTKGELPFLLKGVVFGAGAERPDAGEALLSDEGKKAGEITSVAHSPTLGVPIAIARMGRGFQLAGAQVKAGESLGEVCDLPFPTNEVKTEAERSPLYDEALALFAKDQEDKAIELLRQELEQNPKNYDAWEALGVIQDRLGQHHDAISAMNKIIADHPEHLMANVNLSLYHMKIGDKQTAEDYQAKATQISLKLRMEEARKQGKTFQLEGEEAQVQKLESRLQKFKAIIEMDPEDVLGYFGAGKVCMDLKRFKEGAELFEKVVEIQKDYSVAWANLGICHTNLGNIDRAREVFTQGIEIATEKGDLMPVRDMQTRLRNIEKGESN